VLERWLLAFVDNNDFNTMDLAHRENQLGTEAQQAILVGQHEPAKSPLKNHFSSPLTRRAQDARRVRG
jgi:hypothetical protein